MKRTNSILYTSLFLAVLAMVSCKHEGCTDPLAVNYASKVEVDDGSCSYSTSRMIGDYAYIYDSADYSAIVYFIDLSVMKVEGTFDEDVTNFYMDEDWTSRTMVLPDSLAPEYISANGTITDKDNFRVNMYYQDTVNKIDTAWTYDFTRI